MALKLATELNFSCTCSGFACPAEAGEVCSAGSSIPALAKAESSDPSPEMTSGAGKISSDPWFGVAALGPGGGSPDDMAATTLANNSSSMISDTTAVQVLEESQDPAGSGQVGGLRRLGVWTASAASPASVK